MDSGDVAWLMIAEAAGGPLRILRSTGPGTQATEITWDTVAVWGVSGLEPRVQAWGDSAITVIPRTENVIYTEASLTVSQTATLPPIAEVAIGKKVCVVDGRGVVGAETLSLAPDGSEEIDGANTPIAITVAYGSVCVMSAGTEWIEVPQ